jgi:dTDP-4-dehydrorhamnose reductase
MNIVLTGANGLLGQHLMKDLASKGHRVLGLGKGICRLPADLTGNWSYETCDIAQLKEVCLSVEKFGTVAAFIHAAAETQVDACETNKEKAYETNVLGTENCLKAVAGSLAHFIFISTDFVFDGAKGIYKEEDEMNAVNYYGQTKIQGEALVKEKNIKNTIIRTCLVYGNTLQGTRSNIMTWVKQNLEQGKKIKVVSDQIRTPTFIGDLVAGVELSMMQEKTGVYHISGKDILTPYDMAMHTAAYFGLDNTLIEKVDASSFTQAGQRPLRTGFDISKARQELNYEPISFIEGLQTMYPVLI